MKIEQLQQFLEVVSTGSMSSAADNLYLSKSSLSTSMKNLEKELGGKLFVRSSKGCWLTPFGLEVYGQASDVCEKIEFIKNLKIKDSNPYFSISSMYCTVASEAFIELCKRYNGIHGGVEEYGLLQVIEHVKGGLSEIGFISMFSDGERITRKKLEESEVEFVELKQRRLYAVVGEKNPLFHENITEIDITQLHDYPIIVNYEAPSEYSWTNFFERRAHKRADIQVSDLACALRIIEETNGFMIQTYDKNIYEDMYSPNSYRFIPLSGEQMTCKLGWIKRHDRNLSLMAREYIDIVENLIK